MKETSQRYEYGRTPFNRLISFNDFVGIREQDNNIMESMIPKYQQKYNNNEVEYRATFYRSQTTLDTCCCKV
jgi:hypothetical protein